LRGTGLHKYEHCKSSIYSGAPSETIATGWWFIFHQNGDDNGDLSTALGTRNCLIQALLYNAGIYKINNNKFTLNMDTWESFTGAPSFKEANLHAETIQRIQYVSCGRNLEYRLPKDQPKKQRSRGSTYLPEDIKTDLRYSYDHYEEQMKEIDKKKKKAAAAKQQKAAAKQQKKKDSGTKQTDEFPLLLKIFGKAKDINPHDIKIKELSNSVLSELVKLQGRDSILKSIGAYTDIDKGAVDSKSSTKRPAELDNSKSSLEVTLEVGGGTPTTEKNISSVTPYTLVDTSKVCYYMLLLAILLFHVAHTTSTTNIHQPNKRQKVDDAIITAAKVIAPRYIPNGNTNDWSHMSSHSVGKSQRYNDAKTLSAMLIAICRGNPARGSDALVQLLSDTANNHLRKAVIGSITSKQKDRDRVHHLVIESIQEIIAHHTKSRGTRPAAAETLVKNITAACVFKIVKDKKDVSDHLLSRVLAGQMVEAVCCPRVEQPLLHIDKSKPCPKLIPLKCTHGVDGDSNRQCPCCGIEKKLPILHALKESCVAQEKVEVMEWGDSIRQGSKKGKQNTQRELQANEMTVAELVDKFIKSLTINIPHHQEICWIRLIQLTDFDRLPPDTLLIFTDFAASMCLRAFQTKNSSVDGHAVNDNFVCIYNRRKVKVKEKDDEGNILDDEEKEITVFTCDVHHFFAETISSGKKNDHQMHNVALDAIIQHYKELFAESDFADELRHVIYWSDNAPGQYRCRQNFIKIASVCQRHGSGIKLTHRLAVEANFKGWHDAVGKDPAMKIRQLELEGVRSPTALKVFENCKTHLEKTHDTSKWRKMEEDGDARLEQKGRYGMDSRRVWFVVEDEEEQQRLLAKYPGRILLCTRAKIQDTKGRKCVNESMKTHEVVSMLTEVPDVRPTDGNRVWPIKKARLPCNCQHCLVDPLNDECIYTPWRHACSEDMVENIVPVQAVDESAATSTSTATQDETPAAANESTANANGGEADEATVVANGGDDDDDDSEDEAEPAVEEDEFWQLKKVYTEPEILGSPVGCDGEGCNLIACCQWEEMSEKAWKENLWNTCLECQAKPLKSGLGFSGWPTEKKDIPIKFMSQNLRQLIASKCSKDHNWKRGSRFPNLPFVSEEESRPTRGVV